MEYCWRIGTDEKWLAAIWANKADQVPYGLHTDGVLYS